MFDTLLQIGKILRKAGRLERHRYIKRAPQSDKKTQIAYLSLSVLKDFSFDLANLSQITDEDYIRHKLYFLTFKTSDADSLVKYIFGDICYGVDKNGKESGNYRMSSDAGKGVFSLSSFHRGEEDAKAFSGTSIELFRQSFALNIDKIESLLKEHGNQQQVFLHFDFQGSHWYEFEDELKAINRKLLAEFLGEQKGKFVLRKALFKTIASADKDVQFPRFTSHSQHKVRVFADHDEVLDLFYAIDYSEKPVIKERDIKIIILPKGNNLTAEQIEDFFGQRSLMGEEQVEAKVNAANQAAADGDLLDRLFEPVTGDVAENIVQFDFIFSKSGGISAPDIDLIELAGIEKSFLASTGKRIRAIRQPLQEELEQLYPKRRPDFALLDIRRAFLHILGGNTKDKKKYQSHLFKVLPQIYSATYYRDDVLLPAFIEKTEFNIRKDDPNFIWMKYDFYFLTLILNSNGERFMEEMKKSKSYQAGILLGKLAQPVSRNINSFQKNYVGLLSRRISDLQSLIKFANFINEKLAIHDVAYPSLQQAFVELSQIISQMSERQYTREYCAFGFFESYFTKFEKPVGSSAKISEGDTESQG